MEKQYLDLSNKYIISELVFSQLTKNQSAFLHDNKTSSEEALKRIHLQCFNIAYVHLACVHWHMQPRQELDVRHKRYIYRHQLDTEV